MKNIQAKPEEEKKVERDILRTIQPLVKETLVIFEERMRELGKLEERGKTTNITAPSGSFYNNHEIKSGLKIDKDESHALIKLQDGFIRNVRKLSHNLYKIAVPLKWDEQTMVKITERFESDIRIHTEEFKRSVEKGREELEDAKTYKELWGSYALTCNELNTINRNLDKHLLHYFAWLRAEPKRLRSNTVQYEQFD